LFPDGFVHEAAVQTRTPQVSRNLRANAVSLALIIVRSESMPLTPQWLLASLLLGTSAAAQVPSPDWPFDDAYRDQMLYLHAPVNYSHDLRSAHEWQRRQLDDNSLRVRTGSVSSTELLTDVDLNINEPLNDKWRFHGSFRRSALRQATEPGRALVAGFRTFHPGMLRGLPGC
jgi:hypothetical protein